MLWTETGGSKDSYAFRSSAGRLFVLSLAMLTSLLCREGYDERESRDHWRGESRERTG